MKTILPMLMLTVTASVVGQVRSNYDKFKDETTVSVSEGFINPKGGFFDTKNVSPLRVTLKMRLLFVYKGERLSEPPSKFLISFEAFAGRQWHFLNLHDLIYLADGERVELGPGVRTTSQDLSREYMTYWVDRETLQKLAAAKTLEMQLGRFEAEVSDKQQSQMQQILGFK